MEHSTFVAHQFAPGDQVLARLDDNLLTIGKVESVHAEMIRTQQTGIRVNVVYVVSFIENEKPQSDEFHSSMVFSLPPYLNLRPLSEAA